MKISKLWIVGGTVRNKYESLCYGRPTIGTRPKEYRVGSVRFRLLHDGNLFRRPPLAPVSLNRDNAVLSKAPWNSVEVE
jgi:hypothetical protein